jgi:hypothetical protein
MRQAPPCPVVTLDANHTRKLPPGVTRCRRHTASPSRFRRCTLHFLARQQVRSDPWLPFTVACRWLTCASIKPTPTVEPCSAGSRSPRSQRGRRTSRRPICPYTCRISVAARTFGQQTGRSHIQTFCPVVSTGPMQSTHLPHRGLFIPCCCTGKTASFVVHGRSSLSLFIGKTRVRRQAGARTSSKCRRLVSHSSEIRDVAVMP